nr:immunoglobulin light chain junction region [Macaca mulatta]MOW65299.1 immunoglobulin light chain junction region [Macaca mulatta]
CQQESNWNLTF